MRARLLLSAALLIALSAGSRVVRAEDVLETTEDGTLRLRYQVDEQGRKHGTYEKFHTNGKPAVKATYKVDQREGLERTWDAEGILRTAFSYKQGVLHGSHKTYDEKGHIQLQQTYKRGVLDGSYKSYHPGRRLHVVTTYRRGKRHGKFHERAPDGTSRLRTAYREGRRHGTYEVFAGKVRITKQTWAHGEPLEVDGIVPFPRARYTLRDELARIQPGPGTLPATELEADRVLALAQLKAYRFLLRLPYKDLALDATYNRHAQAGSEVCAAIGAITHTPRNPDWPAARFAIAASGAKNSNLHQGHRACTSVRGYFDDSDSTNIDRLGHRCWCMNPSMLKTRFGHEKGFTAMWAVDDGRTKVPDYEFVSVPPPGYVPGPWFGARWAWSVSLNPKHFDAPRKEAVKALVVPVGDDFLPAGGALALDYANVKPDSTGIPYLVIFRPAPLSIKAGRRYRVTVEGLTHKGKPKALRYFVEFFDVPYKAPRVPRKQHDR